MATSAFKSTTKRTSVGGSEGSSSFKNRAHGRSRSLSRFSHHMPGPELELAAATRGQFVNTKRGSELPEISLDDLAFELFSSKDSLDEKEDGDGRHLGRHGSNVGRYASSTASSSQRRGRSVSRQKSRNSYGQGGFFKDSSGGLNFSGANSRRRRSVSVARSQFSDSDNDIDYIQTSSDQASTRSSIAKIGHMTSMQKLTTLDNRRLRRSHSQKELFKSHDGYLSHSSALTDDETRKASSVKIGAGKLVPAVYAQKEEYLNGDHVNVGLHKTMRKSVRHAVKGIKRELEHALATKKSSALANGDCHKKDNFNLLDAISRIKRNHSTKLEPTAKHKQDLITEILKELLPDFDNSAFTERTLRSRKRSTDRKKMTKRLTEEAEKYFESFIMNIEETDISSFDGERSDTSSTLGGNSKLRDDATRSQYAETLKTPGVSNYLPAEMDGVLLPWLQWETSNDGSSLLSKKTQQMPPNQKTSSWDATSKDMSSTPDHHNSSSGSWSPELIDNYKKDSEQENGSKHNPESCQKSSFDIDEYLCLRIREDHLFEMWRQRNRNSSGGLLLCINGC